MLLHCLFVLFLPFLISSHLHSPPAPLFSHSCSLLHFSFLYQLCLHSFFSSSTLLPPPPLCSFFKLLSSFLIFLFLSSSLFPFSQALPLSPPLRFFSPSSPPSLSLSLYPSLSFSLVSCCHGSSMLMRELIFWLL